MHLRRSVYGLGCLALLAACTSGKDSPSPNPDPSASTGEVGRADPCATLKSDTGPVQATERRWAEIPSASALRFSTLPRIFPSAQAIVTGATSLLDDPPGRVRMVAFWGEPGAHEPDQDTAVTFLGVDGRWRKLTAGDLGSDSWYISAGRNTLSPDGSRWITEVDGRNLMIDFHTGEASDLMAGRGQASTWADDSSAVALWSITRPGASIFDRTGRRTSRVPIDVGERSAFLTKAGQLTLVETAPNGEPALRLQTYATDGTMVRSQTCALPGAYPPRRTGAKSFDGRHLLIDALVHRRQGVFRFTMIDTRTGRVTDDLQHEGYVPLIEDRAKPRLYPTEISGRPHAIYGIDPNTGDMVQLARIYPYQDQEGYENHANSQFARDLVFDQRASNPGSP